MVRTKLRHAGSVAGKKSGTPSCLDDKDDWVIVKKQRVIILIPAAPRPHKISIKATHGPSNKASSSFQVQMGTSTVLPSVNEQEDTTSLAAQKEIQVARKVPPLPRPTLASSSFQVQNGTSIVHSSVNEQEDTTSLAIQKEIQVARKAPPLPSPTLAKNALIDRRIQLEIQPQVNNLKSLKLLGISKASKAIKQPRLLLAPIRSPSLGITLNHGLRASNLERKLVRAGGLSKWLTSLGLGQFVRIFQGKSINKYQLVNLTMKKLKDMGANAVGPRRKLIHAIDCVCQPYCFEAL